MACFNPLGGWYGRKANDSGRTPIVFSLRDGYIDRPIDLPCGKCIGCLRDKANAWAVRCYHESTLHDRNCFVTLTYREEECPQRLRQSDLQRFFKRMRSRGVKLRYFACGEYGGRFGRPHYHALIFGQDFREGSIPLGTAGQYYTAPLLDETWGHGFVTIGALEAGSAFYVAGYSLKNLGDEDAFHCASKRPYIGHGWLAKYHDDIVRNGFVTIGGKRFTVPRSYLDRPEFRFEFDELRESRRAHIEAQTPAQIVARRESARSREINMLAQVSR